MAEEQQVARCKCSGSLYVVPRCGSTSPTHVKSQTKKKKESVRQDFEMKKRKKLLLLFFFFFEMSPEKITYEFSMKKHEI